MAAELDVSVGADDEERAVTEAAGEEAEQEQRGLVRPVQVVEHDHQRSRTCRRGEESGDRVEQAEPLLLRVAHHSRLTDGTDLIAQLGDDAGDLRRARSELPGEADGIRIADVGADRLGPGPVRGRALALVTAAPMDPRALHPGVGGQFLRRARLADPRLPDQQDQAAGSGSRLVDGGAQLAELLLAADEDAAGEAVEGVRLVLGRGAGQGRGQVDRLELVADLGGVRGAVLRSLGEQPQDERLERRGHVGAQPRGRHWHRAQVLAHDRDGVVARERRLAGEHLVEKGTERVEVGARVGRPAQRLLGRQVGDGPDQGALALGAGAALAGQGEPEVAEPRALVLAQPHVRRLQVAVDDAAAVSVLERPADVDRDRHRPLELEPAALGGFEERGHVATRHVLGDDERPARVLAGFDDADDVRVLAELAHRLSFATGPDEDRLPNPLGLEHGDGHGPLVGHRPRQVDALSPALAEEALRPVTPSREILRQVGRRGRLGRRRLGCLGERGAARVAELRALAVVVPALTAAHGFRI